MKGTAPSVARFTFAVRYRIQQQFRTYHKDLEDKERNGIKRVRFELDYDVRGIPLKPYINAEMHMQLLTPTIFLLVIEWRSMVGIEYTLNRILSDSVYIQ